MKKKDVDLLRDFLMDCAHEDYVSEGGTGDLPSGDVSGFIYKLQGDTYVVMFKGHKPDLQDFTNILAAYRVKWNQDYSKTCLRRLSEQAEAKLCRFYNSAE